MPEPSARVPVIHLVDDDDSFRTAVSRLLAAAGYLVKGYRDAGDFLLDPPSSGRGCVLLDVNLPGPSGLDLQEAIARRGDGFPVIFLTGHGDIRQERPRDAGRRGRLPRKTSRAQGAARRDRDGARAGRARRPRPPRRRREVARRFERLTDREREVFEMLVAGRLNKQIGAALGISERTVKAHRAQIMAKMEAGSVAELVHADGLLRQRAAASARLSPPSD